MNFAARLPLVLAFLIGIFVAATGLAAVLLGSLGEPWLAVLAALAGLACIVAGVVSWLVLRNVPQPELPELEGLEQLRSVERQPVVQTLPSEELPSAYVEAVMKGVAANRAAMKARGSVLH